MKPSIIAPLLIGSFWFAPPANRAVDEFDVQGTARVLDDDCIRLTPDARWAAGAAWSKAPLSLDEAFELSMRLGFGSRDALGADGIVLTLTTEKTLGWRGERIGLAPHAATFAIELDTYSNPRQNDPEADHLAFDVHGSTYHHARTGQLAPVELPNLEDGRHHALRVVYDPSTSLTVSLDGVERATFPAEELRRIFGGRPTVSWGLSASTGRKANPHDVCSVVLTSS